MLVWITENVIQMTQFIQVRKYQIVLGDNSVKFENKFHNRILIWILFQSSNKCLVLIGSHLKQYVNNPALSDVQFDVGGTVIYAHKVILCARSEYFR